MALAPRLWLQGAALTTTGGSGSAKQAATWAALADIRAWRLITALGRPVEPEVRRYLAWSSGWAEGVAAEARSRSARGMSPGRALRPAITGRPARKGAARASPNRAASSV